MTGCRWRVLADTDLEIEEDPPEAAILPSIERSRLDRQRPARGVQQCEGGRVGYERSLQRKAEGHRLARARKR